MTADAPSVLIVDDHALLSTTLVIALGDRGVAAHRVDPSVSGAVRQAMTTLPRGVALVDLDLGTGAGGSPLNGVDLVPALVDAGWSVVMVTGTAVEADVAAAIIAGATGWLHKLTPFEQLLEAVVDALAGRPVMAEAERQRLVRLHHAELARQRARRAGFDRLTAREREVLDALVAGRRAAAIAEDSVVSLATVRAQIRSILAKLGVSSQLEAVALARNIDES